MAAFSFKQLKKFATGPEGKKLIAQAKKLDTPENREKAKELVEEVRKRAAPAAKKAVTETKAAAAKVADRKKAAPKKPPGGATPPPA
jgi:cytoskeletal protein RodZ